MNQVSDTVMMVRPHSFHANEETAVNNFYQKKQSETSLESVARQALDEFDGYVEKLRHAGVQVEVFQDTLDFDTPDSLFPNNWNSFHEDGRLLLYPMYAENRRCEVRADILDTLKKKFEVKEIIDIRFWENRNIFLEGTGSLVLDRQNNLAYVALSDRAHLESLKDFESKTRFGVIPFTAYQSVGAKRLPIFHTNVMMCVGEAFAVVCLDSIDDESERNRLIDVLEMTGKEIVEITEEQCNQFAGNMLQLKSRSGERLIVMSESAFKALSKDQRSALGNHGTLLHHSLETIEKYGGGSARCMLAEIFLQPNTAP